MTALKKRIKKIAEKTAGAGVAKNLHYKFKSVFNYFKNRKFKAKNPGISIPPDEWLFETFQLDYQKYFDDGNLAAEEIWKWTIQYISAETPAILDWGCGTGRIIQHLHRQNPYALLYGADINEKMIAWNHQHIKDSYFSKITLQTPTEYPANYFDLVYGISVFTHLSASMQKDWIEEMSRILKPAAILLVTTHGSYFTNQLLEAEKKQYHHKGFYEKVFQKNNQPVFGDRNYTVYETADFFENMIANNFNTVAYFDGSVSPEKFGGQDLWILQKK